MKFFDTALQVEFELYDESNLTFLQDFNQGKNLALNKWKKQAAKIDFTEGEELLFNLLLSLKDDMIKLEEAILHKNSALMLKNKGIISAVAFEGIKFKEQCLQNGALYYAKMSINHHLMSFFFKALNADEGTFTQVKKEDKTLYDNFVVDIQRQLIIKRKDKE